MSYKGLHQILRKMEIAGIGCVILSLFVAHPFIGTVWAQKLYIFIPTEHSAVEIEKKFAEKIPTITVRSFGNVTDFKKSVEESKPDAVITKPQLVAQLTGYTTQLKAVTKGSTEESFVLLSVDKPIIIADIAGKNIGILDFLGKKEIDGLVETLFKGRPVLIKVKKVADLLPLLTMNMVEAIVVSESHIAYLKQRSNLNFIITPCDCSSGRAVLATLKPDPEIEAVIKSMPADLAKLLYIESWK